MNHSKADLKVASASFSGYASNVFATLFALRDTI